MHHFLAFESLLRSFLSLNSPVSHLHKFTIADKQIAASLGQHQTNAYKLQ
jgi:hypothetical protein